MQILVLGGEHPGEHEAIDVALSLIRDPLANVKCEMVNTLGMVLDQRVVGVNMTSAYLTANHRSVVYEEKRAAEILDLVVDMNPDVVVSLHNPGEGDVRYAVVNPARGVSSHVLGALKAFGIERLVTVDYGIMARCDNAVLVEIPKKEIREHGVEPVREFIKLLANGHPSAVSPRDFTWYEQAGGIHIDDVRREELSRDEQDAIGEFERAAPLVEERLGITPLFYTCVLPGPNKEGYWSEVVTERQI